MPDLGGFMNEPFAFGQATSGADCLLGLKQELQTQLH